MRGRLLWFAVLYTGSLVAFAAAAFGLHLLIQVL